MITNGFTYIAVLVFIAALLVWLQTLHEVRNSSTMHHLSFCCTSLP